MCPLPPWNPLFPTLLHPTLPFFSPASLVALSLLWLFLFPCPDLTYSIPQRSALGPILTPQLLSGWMLRAEITGYMSTSKSVFTGLIFLQSFWSEHPHCVLHITTRSQSAQLESSTSSTCPKWNLLFPLKLFLFLCSLYQKMVPPHTWLLKLEKLASSYFSFFSSVYLISD